MKREQRDGRRRREGGGGEGWREVEGVDAMKRGRKEHEKVSFKGNATSEVEEELRRERKRQRARLWWW